MRVSFFWTRARHPVITRVLDFALVFQSPLREKATDTLVLKLLQNAKALRVVFDLQSSFHCPKRGADNVRTHVLVWMLGHCPVVTESWDNNFLPHDTLFRFGRSVSSKRRFASRRLGVLKLYSCPSWVLSSAMRATTSC